MAGTSGDMSGGNPAISATTSDPFVGQASSLSELQAFRTGDDGL